MYSIYSPEGELVKELNRFVSVVDTTAPTYSEKEEFEVYAGFKYSANDFINYSDNYDNNILVYPKDIYLREKGENEIKITLEDSSGNKTVYTKKVEVKLDFIKLIKSVYVNDYSGVSINEEVQYIRVVFSSGGSFSYFGSDDSINYVSKVVTNLGVNASIQISAKYEDFDKANVSFYIGGRDTLGNTIAKATINATISDGEITDYGLTNNGLDLSSNEVLKELKVKLPVVVEELRNYIYGTLNLAVK